jgi:hypothetical protein
MLRITADVFSGRPNPVVEIRDESEARETLRALTRDRPVLADAAAVAGGGLGLRGLHIEVLGDELAQRFAVGSTRSRNSRCPPGRPPISPARTSTLVARPRQ